MISFRIVHQVSSTEAVVQFIDESTSGGVAGRYVAGKDLFVSNFPAREHPPGMVVRDWTVEVIGTRTYQGDNGRKKSALHAKPLEWRKWVDLAKPPRPADSDTTTWNVPSTGVPPVRAPPAQVSHWHRAPQIGTVRMG